METPLLAVAMIVKNEEHFLPGALESIAAHGDLVGEVCIYDTGSTDRTIEIAEEWGAKVERGYWDDDFSRAKNAAAAMCTAKWVLSLDADERLVADAPTFRRILREALTVDLTGLDAFRVWLRNLTEDGSEGSTFPAIRLYRPQRAGFTGEIHEQIMPREGFRLADLPKSVAYLDHLGYTTSSMVHKGGRNFAIADAALRENAATLTPNERADHLLTRARSLVAAGYLFEAFPDYLTCWRLKGTTNLSPLWAAQTMTDLLLTIGAYDDAAVLARELQQDARGPEMADWFMARARHGQGRYAEALELLRRVNAPSNAVGYSAGYADVLRARLLAAALCGEADEAVSSGISLLAAHGQGQGTGPLLLRLWGDRSPATLAQLLAEADRGHREVVAAELRAAGGAGDAVAAELEALLTKTA